MASLNSGSARSSEWYPNIITEKEARLIAKKIMQSASSANIDLPFVKQFETEGYSPATIIGARRELADQVNSGKGIEISDKEYQQMKDYFQQFEMSHIQSEVYKYATESDFPFIVEKSKVYVVPGGRRISDTDAQGYARIILDEAKQRGFVLPAIERWLSEGYSPKNVLEAYEEAFYLNSHGKPQVSSEYRDKLLRYLWRLIPSMEQIAVYKESVSSADPLIRRFTVIELCQWLKLTFPGSYDIVVYDGPVAESSKVLYNKCGLKAPNTPFNLAANPDIEVKIDENLARVYFLMEDDKRLYRVMWSCRAQDVQRNYVGQLVQVLYNAARHIQKPEQEVKRSPEMATNIFEMKFTLDELYKWVKAKYSDSGSFSVTKSWSHSYENIFDGELLDRTYARKFFTLSKKLEMRVNRTKYEQGGVGEFISFHLDQDGNEYVANLHLNKTRQDTGYINDIVPLLLKSADVAFSSSNRIAKKDNLLNRTFSLLELADWFKANFPKADDLSVTGDGYIFEGGQVFEGGKVKAAAAYKSRLFELGDQIEYELFRHSATNIMKFRIVGKTRVYKVHFRFKVNADTKTYISTLIQAISDAGGIPFKASKRKNEESMKSNRKKLSAGGTVSSIESPMIYVADLEAYNQGKLVGDWLDLSFYSSGSEVTEAISELLAKWSEEQGVKREEYAIHDMENVPSGLLSDGAGEAEFEKVIRLYEKADEMDVPMDVLLEAMKDTGNDDLDNIQEMYQGRYRDKEAFGQHLQEDGLVTDVSPFLSMRETDRTIAANEMADQEVGEMRDDKLISEADMDDELEELDDKQSAKDDLTEQIEGLESEVDELKDLEDAASPADARAIHANRLQKELELAGKKAELEELASFDYDKEKDALVERAKAQVQSDLFDKAYAGMKDPVAYFVDEQGLYTRENLGEQNFIVVDYEALADDSLSDYVVVEHDGELYVFNGSYAKGGKLPSDSSGKGGLRDEIVKLIRTELQDEKDDHQEHLLIVESLRPLEGKKFTMRAQGLLPAGFTLFTDINGYEVKSPRGRNHNIVRHSDTASFSISKLNDYNAPYNAGAKQRSEKLQKLLESQAQLEKVVEVFVELKAAYDDLEKAIASIEPYDSFNFPTYYDALRLCGIDSSRISDIKYKRMEKGGILALNSDADMEEFKRKFKKMVEDDLQTEIDDHNEFLLLVEALKPLEGKKFTMRAQTKLPEGYVLRKDFNGFVVTSPRGKKHNIIRDSDSANFTIAKFADYDGPYNAGSKGRIEKLRRFTDSPKKMQAVIAAFASLCRAYHRFVAAVDEAESHDAYNFPAYYDVLRLLKIDSNLMSEIR
ncbi:MAG TPA: antirestriction protein ArdA, partial [Anaerovoracaceae bacterium]|nr:antirestriction protein ArdA [Anaerovoracaceae bacterium]